MMRLTCTTGAVLTAHLFNMDNETLQALTDYNDAVIQLAQMVRDVGKEMRAAQEKSEEAIEGMRKVLEDVSKYSHGGGIGNKINLSKNYG